MKRRNRAASLLAAAFFFGFFATTFGQAATPEASPAAAPLLPDQAALQRVANGLPADPVDAAIALANLVLDGDQATAEAATAELLRRAGVPIVATDGPVIGLPDQLVLTNVPVYIEQVRDLTRAVRRGDAYEPADFAQLLAVAGLVDASGKPLDPGLAVAMLGQWGKTADAPLESRIAGAAVRALAAHRGQLLAASEPDVAIDPLQTVLVLAHLVGEPSLATPGQTAASGARALLASGLCDTLGNSAKTPAGAAAKGGLKQGIIKGAKQAAPSVATTVTVKAPDIGADALTAFLLLTGAQIDINDNQGGLTHFKHKRSDRSHDVHVTATARFDSTLGGKNIGCYNLAGIKVPPSGPFKGIRVRWRLNQTIGQMDVDPAGPESTIGHSPTGLYLTQTKASAPIVQDGVLTGADGAAAIDLKPPTEETPGKGDVHHGFARVTAYLDKQDLPLKATDALKLANPATAATGFLLKLINIMLDMLTKAGLPEASETVRVDYHGLDIYTAKGQWSANVGAGSIQSKIDFDLYTCDGLNGTWRGSVHMTGDFNDLGVAGASGRVGSDKVKVSFATSNQAVLINVGSSAIKLQLLAPPPQPPGTHNNGAVGLASLFMDDLDLAGISDAYPIAYTGGSAPVIGVASDKRCTGGGWYFDQDY